jgi:predicted small lipoprotein YifL
MKKTLVVAIALLTAFSVAGCASVGKAPVGKAPAPVVAKG